jgi:hypothetical protein
MKLKVWVDDVGAGPKSHVFSYEGSFRNSRSFHRLPTYPATFMLYFDGIFYLISNSW